MNVRDNFLTQIKKAASQYAVYGDPQALADIISQVQQENTNHDNYSCSNIDIKMVIW